jgi:aminobenzoyl-glutamate transport protein
VLLGIVSSIASDAGYLVLIPLGAAAFKSVGRNPLAGIAAAFAGVAAGFGVNFLITPLDGVLTEITNDAAGSGSNQHIDLAANLYFGIASTIFVAIVLTFITAKLVEGRLGEYDPADAGEGPQAADDAPDVAPEAEARGLRYALWGTLVVLAAVTLLTAIPGAPLRNPDTGKVIGDSPFMDSLIVIIMAVFYVAGYLYGRGAGTIKGSADVI